MKYILLLALLVISIPIIQAYGHTPEYAINSFTGEKNQIITQYYTHINDSSNYLSTTPVYNISQICETQYNHSNFTSNVWSKYCIDPQSDQDYNG